MSQFVSDFLTWSTLGVALGASLLGNVTIEPNGSQDDLVLLASSVSNEELVGILADGQTTQVVPSRAATFDNVPQADLISVTFAANGIDDTRISAPDRSGVYGTVTGSSVNIRTGPGTGFAIAGRGSKDDEFRVTGERDGSWVQIILPSADEPVWIHGNYFNAPS